MEIEGESDAEVHVYLKPVNARKRSKEGQTNIEGGEDAEVLVCLKPANSYEI